MFFIISKIPEVIPYHTHDRPTVPCFNCIFDKRLSIDGKIPPMSQINQLLQFHLIHWTAVELDELVGNGS